MRGTGVRTAPTATSEATSPAPAEQALPHRVGPSDPVMRLVHRTPVIVSLDTPLRTCARVLAEESIGAVLVDGPHGPAGVLSERDVVAAVAEGAGVAVNRARDFMTAEIDTVPETATIAATAREMLRNEIRHVVVTRGERAVGIVSIRDILAVLADSEPGAA